MMLVASGRVTMRTSPRHESEAGPVVASPFPERTSEAPASVALLTPSATFPPQAARPTRRRTAPVLMFMLCMRSSTGPVCRITLKRPFADGTVAVDMDPLSLLSRLATAMPPPRRHTVRYAGILAPASKLRPNRSGRSPALLDGGYVGLRRANTAC